MARASHDISIRLAYPDDADSLRRLEALDSAPNLRAPVLVAEVDGELRAALSLSDGQAAADPFRDTGDLLVLLKVHGAQLDTSGSGLRSSVGLWRALGARRPVAQTSAPRPGRLPERPLSLAAYGLLH